MILFLSLFVVIQSLSGLIAVVIECPVIPITTPNHFTYDECAEGSSTCTYYSVGIGPNADNDSFVDFYLETSAKGYGAVGFSKNRKMPSADVLGCGRDNNGGLHVRDTWNPAYYNEDDPNQDGVCIHSITYENSIIKCSFSRYVAIVNPQYDLNLNDIHYLMFAYSDSQEYQNGFPPHSFYKLPRVSNELVSVFDNGSLNGYHEVDWSGRLVRAHGILMTVAWPLLAAIGIFFSAWTKPAFPKGQWFQFHRALMISSIAVSLIGLVLVFVAHKDNPVPGIVEFNCGQTIAHFIIGIIVTALQLLNPVLALLRCKPESKYRIIFNVFHGSIVGFVTELLALLNVGLGIALFQCGCGALSSMSYILWVYMGWIGFFVIFQACLLFALSLVSNDNTVVVAPLIIQPLLKFYQSLKKCMNPKSYKHLKDSSDTDDLDYGGRMKWKDRNIRSKAVGIFILVTVSICAVLVVLLAVTDDGEKE